MRFILASGLWARISFVSVCCASLLASSFWTWNSESQFANSKSSIFSLGLNTLVVQTRAATDAVQTASPIGPADTSAGTQRGLSTEQVEELVKLMPRVNAVACCYQLATPQKITVKDRIVDATVFGCEPELATILKLQFDKGRFLTAQDNVVGQTDERFLACVISSKLAEKLFPFEDPIGKRIHLINNSYPVVVGVLKPPPGELSDLLMQEMEFCIFVPHQSFATIFKDENAQSRVLNHLAIQLGVADDFAGAASSIDTAIQRFGIQNSTQIISTKSKLDQLNGARTRPRALQMGLLATVLLFTVAAVVFATFAEGPLEAKNIYASRGSRLRAQIVDSLISSTLGLLIAVSLIYFPSVRKQLSPVMNPTAVILIGFIAYLLIHGYPIVQYGQSWGKRMCRIAVVNQKNGLKIGFLRYFMRELIRFLFGFPVLGFRFAFLSIVDAFFIFSRSRRCLHDWIAQTSVVKVREPNVVSSNTSDATS